MIKGSDMSLMHATGLLRLQGPQKNWKRPMKVAKAKWKARIYEIPILYIFFGIVGIILGY